MVAQIKSIKGLLLCFGSGDTNYPQKLSKFTTFEALFDFHGYFMYIIMLQIFGNIVGCYDRGGFPGDTLDRVRKYRVNAQELVTTLSTRLLMTT